MVDLIMAAESRTVSEGYFLYKLKSAVPVSAGPPRPQASLTGDAQPPEPPVVGMYISMPYRMM